MEFYILPLESQSLEHSGSSMPKSFFAKKYIKALFFRVAHSMLFLTFEKYIRNCDQQWKETATNHFKTSSRITLELTK